VEAGKKNFISVVIPLLNERDSIMELYSRLTEVLSARGTGHELLFIDDGSTDGSLDVLLRIRENDRRAKIVSFKRNFGKSAALSEGFRIARGDIVVTIDADLQDDPGEIPGLIDRLDEGYDLVSGWKVDRRDPLSKTFPSKIWNLMTSLVSGIKLHDFNCGLKAYRGSVVKRISVYGELHRFIPVLAAWEGFKVTEKEVTHSERKYGQSKYGTKRFLNGIFDLITVMFITRRATSPLHFFGRIALTLFVLGGIINLYFLILWFAGKGLHVRPLMVGGMIMIVLAMQIGSFGLLAELFSSRQERTFSYNEYQLDD
jgi:glycosyltransferase involved in cell wall biosynthesis